MRRAAHLSQQALSERTGIPLRTLARRETAQRGWTTEEIAAIADALDACLGDERQDGFMIGAADLLSADERRVNAVVEQIRARSLRPTPELAGAHA